MRLPSRLNRLPLGVVVLSGFLSLLVPTTASAVAMWSRRYGVPCGYCHAYPSLQLTADGADFFRRGHRIKDDSWDKKVTDLISVHGEWQWDVQQRESTAFQTPAFHIHAGGALTKAFSAYVDATINEALETAYLQYTKEWGSNSYFTTRAGKVSPTLIRDYGNGLMAEASRPLILIDTLADNPFSPTRDSLGVDIGARWNSVFVQTGVINGEDIEGQASVRNHKDFYATGEVALPDGLSGVGLYYYRGGYDLGDPTVSVFFDRYEREGVFANYTRDRFRLAGAYLYGKDRTSTLAELTIYGYYAQLDFKASDWLVTFVRWDDVTKKVEGASDRTQQINIGCAISLFQSEVTAGRAVLEASRRKEGGVYTNAGLLNLLWIF